jgi:hypothetical protein
METPEIRNGKDERATWAQYPVDFLKWEPDVLQVHKDLIGYYHI